MFVALQMSTNLTDRQEGTLSDADEGVECLVATIPGFVLIQHGLFGATNRWITSISRTNPADPPFVECCYQ